jgi:hypothetical protein
MAGALLRSEHGFVKVERGDGGLAELLIFVIYTQNYFKKGRKQ